MLNLSGMFSDCNINSFEIIHNENSAITGNTQSAVDMFADARDLTECSNMNTRNLTNAARMFLTAESLREVPNFDTKNVTNMRGFLEGCYNLNELPNYDTSKVTDMSHAFSNLNIKSIPNFRTNNVTNMSYAFAGDYEASGSVPNFNTAKVTDMSYMLSWCYFLETIPEFDTNNVTDFSWMLAFTSVNDIPNFNFSKADDTSNMFRCTQLSAIEDLDLHKSSSHSPSANASYMFYRQASPSTGTQTVNNITITNYLTAKGLFENSNYISSVSNLQVTNTNYCNNMFYGCTRLASIVDTTIGGGKSTYVNSVFTGCTNLTTLNNVSINGSNSGSDEIFVDCANLTTIDNLNININGRNLFRGKTKLMKATNVTCGKNNAAYMFAECNHLTNVDGLTFSYTGTVDFQGLFSGGGKHATGINGGGFNSKAGGFAGTDITITAPGMNSSRNLCAMFAYCQNLVNAPMLNTNRVNNMAYMFGGCTNLRNIPIYDTNNLANGGFQQFLTFVWQNPSSLYQQEYYGCNNLTTESVKNVVKMCLNANKITNATYKNLSNANRYSPFYKTKYDSSYYTDLQSQLTAAGWTF